VSDAREVVREFGANRVAMAAEILRLRRALDDVRFDLMRAAAMGVSGLLVDPMPPADVTPRPVGYRL
jgi:hypothetical protein